MNQNTKLLGKSIAAASIATLMGCTDLSVTSTPLETSSEQQLGIPYALPIGMVKLTLAQNGKTKAFTVTGPTVVHVPDQKHRFLLSYKPSGFASDTNTFTINNSGLLTSVDAEAADQSVAIAEGFSTLLTNIASDGTKSTRSDKDETLGDFRKDLFFDPMDKESIKAARRQLVGTGIHLDITGPDGRSVSTAKGHKGDPVVDVPNDESKLRSVYFRTVLPYTVTLKYGNANLNSKYPILVPDKKGYAALDIARAACVTKKTAIILTDGVMTSLNVIKPSEVSGCLSIPSTLVKSILGLPNARRAGDAADLESQRALVAAQTALLQAQAALAAEQE